MEDEGGCELSDIELGDVLEFDVVGEIPQPKSEYGGCGGTCPGYEVYPTEGIVEEWEGVQRSGSLEAPSFGAAFAATVEGCAAHITLEMWPLTPQSDEPSKIFREVVWDESCAREEPRCADIFEAARLPID
jgi:hypothetical protein